VTEGLWLVERTTVAVYQVDTVNQAKDQRINKRRKLPACDPDSTGRRADAHRSPE